MNNRIHKGSQPAINPLSVRKQTRDLTSDHSQLSIIPVQKLPTVDNSSQFSISSRVIRPHSDGMLLCPTASDSSMLLYVHRVCIDYYRRGAQDGHLDFTQLPSSVASCSFTVALLYYTIFVQRFEPQGRRFTNFHYYYYVHRDHTDY